MGKYKENYIALFGDIDRFGELSIVSLVNYFEDIALRHSNSIGLGLDKLEELNFAWMINKWYISMEKYPKYNEKFKITTWAPFFDKVRAGREYIIFDQYNNTVGKATSLWIFLNTTRRRPIRIPDDIANAYEPEPERAIEYEFSKAGTFDIENSSKDINIRKSDVDLYGHVNNKRYIEWMEEIVPDNIYEKYKMVECEIAYYKEVVYGSNVKIKIKNLKSSDNENKYENEISDNENNRCVWGFTRWKEKR